MPLKPIFTSLSPNVEKDDLNLVVRLIFRLFKPQKQQAQILEQEFKQYLNAKHAFAFNAGRTAFLAILKSLNLTPGNEILIQGFTCNALVNPILAAGLKPIFVDIKETTFNIDPTDLETKITDRTKAVVIQHTFGLPADMEKITDICQKYNLILIEDCAHALGAEYNGRKLGSFGKASFFSFGRDKVISSVFGGLAVTNNDDLAEKIRDYQQSLPQASVWWIFQQLLHPILTKYTVMPAYNLNGSLGKLKLITLQKIGLLSKAVSNREKQGKMPENFARKMPEPLVAMALRQIEKLGKFIDHQRQIAQIYDNGLAGLGFGLPARQLGRIYLRYPILIKNQNTDKILEQARKQKIFLDDGWRKTVVVPPDTDQTKMNYRAGDCPVAEKVAKSIVNLPTHINISQDDAARIINFITKI